MMPMHTFIAPGPMVLLTAVQAEGTALITNIALTLAHMENLELMIF